MELKRVVVTGLGALTPLGNSVSDYWNGLINGVSGANLITRFDASKFKTRFACELKGYNVEDHFDRKEARKMDPYTHYALIVVKEALEDSGLLSDTLDKDRVGVIWGSGIGGLLTFQEECFTFAKGDGTPRFNPFFIPKMIADIASGHISIQYGFRGPNYTTVSACASSTNALIGGGCLILEEYEHAKARGAKIYCEIVGGGMSADAYHITAPHPEGIGATNVMRYALEDAGMKPEDIDYINVHGTSTPLGDVQESRAIQKIFNEHAYNLNISSTKSMTGHLLGAAGAIESIATILALKNNIVPPTINFNVADPELDPKLNFTFNKAQQRTVNAAMSNTFGFGGHNTSAIFRKI